MRGPPVIIQMSVWSVHLCSWGECLQTIMWVLVTGGTGMIWGGKMDKV